MSDRQPRRRPTQAEIEMWHAVLQDVKPLSGRKRVPRPMPPPQSRAEPPVQSKLPPAPPPPPSRPQPLPELIPGLPVGLDHNSGRRLKQGRYQVEARLDLHGMTQEQAYYALMAFLVRSAEMDRRCVLIITGKGFRRLGEGGDGARETGILRSLLPRWLNERANRERVLAVTEAQPKDGGGGAFYVLLRRRR